jgi:hypothetical protein
MRVKKDTRLTKKQRFDWNGQVHGHLQANDLLLVCSLYYFCVLDSCLKCYHLNSTVFQLRMECNIMPRTLDFERSSAVAEISGRGIRRCSARRTYLHDARATAEAWRQAVRYHSVM